MKNVMLLGGKRRSGKDHSGAILINRFGFHRVSYGNALKTIIYSVLNISFDRGEQMKNDNHIAKVEYCYFNNLLMNAIYNMNDSDYVLEKKSIENLKENLDDIIQKYVFMDGQAELINITQEIQKPGQTEPISIGIELHMNVRMALQHIASMFKEIFDPEIWTRICLHQILNCEFDNVVATDFRFPYEDFRHMLESKDLNIITVGVIGKNRYDYDPVLDSHESETALNNYHFDYALNNTVYSEDDIVLTVQLKSILKERGVEWKI